MISPTRSALLETKKKIKLAVKGHGLLKKKQDFLINELFRLSSEYMKAQQGIYEKTQKVYRALTMDIAYSGISVSRSASLAAKPAFDLTHEMKNIMGVKIPQLAVQLKDEKLNTYERSPQLVEVAEQYKQLLQDVVAFSSLEQSLVTLAEEVKKMKRRVNFLENIRIPELKKLADDIKFVLAEQERENFARLKKLQH